MTWIELPDVQAAVKKLSKDETGFPALDWSQCPAVESVPERVGGAWVFKDTRMPVSAVFENLEDGISTDELIELYDGLTRDQVEALLDLRPTVWNASRPSLVSNAHPLRPGDTCRDQALSYRTHHPNGAAGGLGYSHEWISKTLRVC